MTELKPGERLDDTGFGGLKVIQGGGFSYGVDSVLLSAWTSGQLGARPVRGSRVKIMDLGTGNGVIPLILSHKIPGSDISGIELRTEAWDMARRTAAINGLEDRLSFINEDVNNIRIVKPELEGSFNAVVSNPPYFKAGSGIPSADSGRLKARYETSADLGDFLRCAAYLLKPGGSFYMVHRPFRLADIIWEMRNCHIEPKAIRPVVPRKGKRPNILLVHGVKGAGPEMEILSELAVHSSKGYTEELLEIYR